MKDFKQLYLELERRAECGEISWKKAMAAAVTLALATECEPSNEAVNRALELAGESERLDEKEESC
jgi:hypothetical protein